MINFTRIKIENQSDSDPDGYGGELTWYYTTYTYGKKSIRNEKRDYSGFSGISEAQLAELVGKPFTLDLRKQLYRTNQTLFHQVRDMNREIHEMVIQDERGNDLIKLASLHKKLKKYWDEYDALYRDVHGSTPSRYSYN